VPLKLFHRRCETYYELIHRCSSLIARAIFEIGEVLYKLQLEWEVQIDGQ
jgi:hypothetical protein